MKVHLVTAASEWGGAEVHGVAVARTLESRGHDVAIVELGRNAYARHRVSRQIQTPIIHVPLDADDRLDARFCDVGWVAWWRILRRLKGDVLVYMKGAYDVNSRAFDVAARLSSRRYVTIEALACPMPPKTSARHFGIVPGFGLWWHRLKWKRRLHSAWPHAVVCVCEAVRQPLAQHYGFRPSTLVTVNNGIDIDQFRHDAAQRQALRRCWGVPADALVFGAVGRLNAVKGYDTFPAQWDPKLGIHVT